MSRSAGRLSATLKDSEQHRVDPGSRVRLDCIPTDASGGYTRKKDADADLKQCIEETDGLARILAAEAKRALLLIAQDINASGKDGFVRHVFTGVNPQFCKVTAFVEPDAEERAHDYSGISTGPPRLWERFAFLIAPSMRICWCCGPPDASRHGAEVSTVAAQSGTSKAFS